MIIQEELTKSKQLSLIHVRKLYVRKNVTGFTLKEVVITLAIFGALAAVLVPVMAKISANARLTAHQNTCMDNMRVLTLALNQYVNDNDQTYPYAVFNGDTFGKGDVRHEYSWAYAVMPYVKGHDAKAFVCPSSPPPSIEKDFQISRLDISRTYFPILQFADNLDPEGSAIILDSRRPNGTRQDKVTSSTILDPTNTAWLIEAGDGGSANTCYTASEHGEYTANRKECEKGGKRENQIGRWHDGATAFAMADGHVKCATVEDSIDSDRHKDWWSRKK